MAGIGEVDDEIVLPGLVGKDGSRGSLGFSAIVPLGARAVTSKAERNDEEVTTDDEEVRVINSLVLNCKRPHGHQ